MANLRQKIDEYEYLKGELECEDSIILDKQRFGRVRTSMMKHLRSTYGEKTANRALSRINKRSSTGSLRIEHQLKSLSVEEKL